MRHVLALDITAGIRAGGKSQREQFCKSSFSPQIQYSMNPFLGAVFHWLGGLAFGNFYVPYRGVKKWSWETYWLVGGFFSWIICPWVLR
jgi:hypothetical protein